MLIYIFLKVFVSKILLKYCQITALLKQATADHVVHTPQSFSNCHI